MGVSCLLESSNRESSLERRPRTALGASSRAIAEDDVQDAQVSRMQDAWSDRTS